MSGERMHTCTQGTHLLHFPWCTAHVSRAASSPYSTGGLPWNYLGAGEGYLHRRRAVLCQQLGVCLRQRLH